MSFATPPLYIAVTSLADNSEIHTATSSILPLKFWGTTKFLCPIKNSIDALNILVVKPATSTCNVPST